MLGVQSNSLYMDNLQKLVSLLPESIRKQTMIRPKSANLIGKPARVSGEQILENLGGIVEVDFGIHGLNETQGKNRISVVTYNETTVPNNLMMGYPTIIFWDPKYEKLSLLANNIYQQLLSAKIFHQSPESAMRHLVEIWENIDMWWQSPDTIKARLIYCEYFARQTKFPALAIANAVADYR